MTKNNHRSTSKHQPPRHWELDSTWSLRHWSLVIWAITFSIATFLTGCRSAKPPPPRPPALEAAERLTAQAEKFSGNQNWPQAARLWQEAGNQFALLNDQARLAIAWHNLAEANQNLGKLEEAEELLGRAAEINEGLGRRAEWWRNEIALLQVEALAQKAGPLQARFERLRPQAAQQKDPLLRGLFLNELGLWQQTQGDLQQAEGTFRESEQAFSAAKNPAGIATALANQARLAEAQKNYKAAVEIWRAALGRFEALAETHGISDSLAGLGRTCLEAGKDLPAAEGYLRHAAANYKTLRLSKKRAKTLEYLARCLTAQGKEKEAQSVRQEAQGLR